MRELEYPFDPVYILKKKKSIKKELLNRNVIWTEKKIAVLGGSTTRDIKEVLELFLLVQGIRPVFYESEYNQFYEDIIFDNPSFLKFRPDIIYIHTTSRNIRRFPVISDTSEEIDTYLQEEYNRYEQVWKKIETNYASIIIQNNFELPNYRLMGNLEFSDIHGSINYINRLNAKFAEYAYANKNFYINDINYLAACYGLQRWSDSRYWHMYKYALAGHAIPELAYNIANIIKSILGKNKKVLCMDLDNTLWGGVIGDDGVDNIHMGQESNEGQLFSEFQNYIKKHKDIGVILTINSKNEENMALEGLKRNDAVLHPEDFVAIKANWNSKDSNIRDIAEELNLGADAIVFVDDNPAEREIVRVNMPEVTVPEIGCNTDYITVLDRSAFFEVTTLSNDDKNRTEMYKTNIARKKQQESFTDYGEYLRSLAMRAEIGPFVPEYIPRIAQLVNKSNQFNLTTQRYTIGEIEEISKASDNISLYGRLWDKFGDNGIVTVVCGHIDADNKKEFHIDLWLMSCRVLKRDMEYAMMDELIRKCRKEGIDTVYGYYYPTAKNAMVKEFYSLHGFKLLRASNEESIWELKVAMYKPKKPNIEIIRK